MYMYVHMCMYKSMWMDKVHACICSLHIVMTLFLSFALDEGPVCAMTSIATSLTLSSLGSLGQLAFSYDRGSEFTTIKGLQWFSSK